MAADEKALLDQILAVRFGRSVRYSEPKDRAQHEQQDALEQRLKDELESSEKAHAEATTGLQDLSTG